MHAAHWEVLILVCSGDCTRTPEWVTYAHLLFAVLELEAQDGGDGATSRLQVWRGPSALQMAPSHRAALMWEEGDSTCSTCKHSLLGGKDSTYEFSRG